MYFEPSADADRPRHLCWKWVRNWSIHFLLVMLTIIMSSLAFSDGFLSCVSTSSHAKYIPNTVLLALACPQWWYLHWKVMRSCTGGRNTLRASLARNGQMVLKLFRNPRCNDWYRKWVRIWMNNARTIETLASLMGMRQINPLLSSLPNNDEWTCCLRRQKQRGGREKEGGCHRSLKNWNRLDVA